MKSLSAAEVKARFAACLRSAEAGQPTMITRHGRPVAALVDAEAAAQVERLRAAGPGAGLAGIAGGWKGSPELVEIVRAAKRRRPRRAR